MKTLRNFLVTGLVILVGAGVASANDLPADARNVRDVRIFRNVSGGSLTSGTGYVLQDANTDSNVLIGAPTGGESSLGLDVTTTTSADNDDFVGCQLDDTCIDDGLCRIVTYGPAICRWAGSTDNTNTRLADVGTTTLAGRLGSGTFAGTLLSLTLTENDTDTEAEEANGLQDTEVRWVWVQPQNN